MKYILTCFKDTCVSKIFKGPKFAVRAFLAVHLTQIFRCCYGSAKIGNKLKSSVTRLGNFCTMGNFLKHLPTINLPKSPTLLGNFCKGVKICHFSSEIIFG